MPVIEDVQSWSTTAITNENADPGINWAEHMPRADVNNSSRSVMAAIAKQRNMNNGSIVTTGTAAVMGYATPIGYSTIPTGLRITAKMGFTNAAGVLLSVDGTAAVAIKDLYGNNLKAGVLPINSLADFIYNGSNWILLGPSIQSIAGVTDGSNAAVGMVGEVASGASGNWAIGVGQIGTLASLASLSAGDWELWGAVAGTGSAGSFGTLFVGPTLNSSTGAVSLHGAYTGPAGEFYVGTTPMTVNIAVATVYYLTLLNSSGSSASISGTTATARIFARRMH